MFEFYLCAFRLISVESVGVKKGNPLTTGSHLACGSQLVICDVRVAQRCIIMFAPLVSQNRPTTTSDERRRLTDSTHSLSLPSPIPPHPSRTDDSTDSTQLDSTLLSTVCRLTQLNNLQLYYSLERELSLERERALLSVPLRSDSRLPTDLVKRKCCITTF